MSFASISLSPHCFAFQFNRMYTRTRIYTNTHINWSKPQTHRVIVSRCWWAHRINGTKGGINHGTAFSSVHKQFRVDLNCNVENCLKWCVFCQQCKHVWDVSMVSFDECCSIVFHLIFVGNFFEQRQRLCTRKMFRIRFTHKKLVHFFTHFDSLAFSATQSSIAQWAKMQFNRLLSVVHLSHISLPISFIFTSARARAYVFECYCWCNFIAAAAAVCISSIN